MVKWSNIGSKIEDRHVDELIERKTRDTELLGDNVELNSSNNGGGDKFYQAQKLLLLFKRTTDDDDSLLDKIWLVIDIPLNLMRDLTVPMSETDAWDRNRGALFPLILPFAFYFLNGDLVSNDDSNINDEEGRAEEISET